MMHWNERWKSARAYPASRNGCCKCVTACQSLLSRIPYQRCICGHTSSRQATGCKTSAGLHRITIIWCQYSPSALFIGTRYTTSYVQRRGLAGEQHSPSYRVRLKNTTRFVSLPNSDPAHDKPDARQLGPTTELRRT